MTFSSTYTCQSTIKKQNQQRGVNMRKLAPALLSHRGDFLIPRLRDDEVNSYRVYLKAHHISIKYKRESKLQIWRLSGKVRMCYPFQPTGRPISHRNEWSFLVYVIPSRDFAPERNFRSGAAIGMNSRQSESPQHDLTLTLTLTLFGDTM